ncbi:hypothetical protein SAMN05444266_105135 [Chitinophaga jiangningensis]|uniref:DUF748 domain-containing protein n=1 Tax=Chitinophaga jiangningensis TaxID=1419482 RepID=A0A1M7DTN3_9BACT|nr:hypothetical protein [Chitinophaga jiangningensis]SHL82881.1 hypothetical protein SAMN05444266_105135 [Chitinophaga jiangningensis]
MERKFHIIKALKVIGIVLGGLVILVLGTAWYLNHHWNKLIRAELKSYVQDLSDSLYRIEYKDVKLDVLSGSVTVDKASMILDTAVYRKKLANQTAPSEIYLVSVEKLELKYFKPWRYFRNNEINAGLLRVTAPSIVMEQDANVIDTSQPKTAYQNISPKLKSILIGKLVLDSTNFRYKFTKKDSSTVIHQFKDLSVRVNDFLIDSLALDDPTRFLYARNYEIGMKDYVHRTKDSLYYLNVKGIRYVAAEQTLEIKQVELNPRYEKEAFNRKLGHQQDYYHVVLEDVNLKNLNPKRLLQDQQVWAHKLIINGGKLEVYRDRRLPMPPGNKLGQYPNQMLAKLRVPIAIDTLIGRRFSIHYMETSPESDRTGTLRFGNVNGHFHNLTNVDSLVKKNNHLTARLDAILMSSGKLTAHFDFILGSKNGNFSVAGELKDLNGRELNPVTKPLGKVEIRSCNIHELSFRIRGDERKAAGEVKLLYDHLKIAILKQNKESKEFERKGLISLLANLMVVRDSNPLPGEKTRVTHPALQRDIQKSFFNLVWKTIFQGVKETVGADKI